MNNENRLNSINQYLTFQLDEEVFAFEIARVQSVLEFDNLNKVPQMPSFMKGVINLRGSVVPVIDLKEKLGRGTIVKNVDTCIIIIEILLQTELTTIGVLADAVREVIEINSKDIDPPPKIGKRLDTSYLKGMGKKDDLFVMIVDLEYVFSFDDVESVKYATKERASEMMMV